MITDRIIAIDYGTERVGIAISDATGTIAQSLETIRNNGEEYLAEQIQALIAENNAKKVVVGLPRALSGRDTEQTLITLKFIDFLKKKLSIEVITWDERFSTKEAVRGLIEADISRKKRKNLKDKIAAQLILQFYLDTLNINNV